MIEIAVVLEGQTIPCEGKFYDQVYKGRLSNPIEEKKVLEFWNEYESAVNNLLLTEVDTLESNMTEFQFFVLVNGMKFSGSEIDLQIYPSAMTLSFSVPKTSRVRLTAVPVNEVKKA